MSERRVLPKAGAVIGVLAAAAFLASHINAWFFAPPEQGSHVERDFVAAGFAFAMEQRFAGVLLEGLPKLAYALAFLVLVPLLWFPIRFPPRSRFQCLNRAMRGCSFFPFRRPRLWL